VHLSFSLSLSLQLVARTSAWLQFDFHIIKILKSWCRAISPVHAVEELRRPPASIAIIERTVLIYFTRIDVNRNESAAAIARICFIHPSNILAYIPAARTFNE